MRADRKYTDRDVREMENVAQLVSEYLGQYQGEFDFLVDCKMRIASGVGLSTGMMRGVLNCMRADPRVRTQLPEPLEPEDGTVLPLRAPGRMTPKKGSPTCSITEPHYEHMIPKGDYQWEGHCQGIYEINREYFVDAAAHVKAPYLMAQSLTSLVHRVDPEGNNAYTRWFTERHGIGFVFTPNLYVRPLCKFPRLIRNPILLVEDDERTAAREECWRCFDGPDQE